MIHARYLLGAATGLLLAGCQAEPPPSEAGPSLCRPEAAASLVGRERISDEEARRLTGAANVRQVGPGDPVTMDFRQDRVTIETDPATGRIVRASCG